MSHEIRTPLHGILGVTSVLEASELNSKQRDLVETIKDSGDYLLTTLNDILDLTKAEEGQLKLVLGSHSPKKVLEHIAHLFEKPIVDKGLKFTLNIAPDIPEVTQMDQSRTAQVVSNLVNNAMKFTETGEISLSASWDRESDFVGELIIEVKDTGVGIENTQRIWQLFEQEKYGLNRPKGGSGLGLAIVRSLVQLLDGTIRVDSVPGEGSCFTVVLPMRTQTGASAHTPKRELPSLATHRVLVVDDNRVNQLIIKEMLMSLEQKVEIVSNAEKAFKLFGTHSYDALFMDVHMPNIDGMQATQKLRGMKIKQPYIVALTADAFPETRRQAIDAGMDDYVTKPFVKMDIAEALKRFEERQNSHTHKRLR
jgi:CheY-like chemotaxis protein/anti-sigma regulatory factor (Ser/Thr protein kinase)